MNERKPKMIAVRLKYGYCPANPYNLVQDGGKVEIAPPENAVRSIYDKVARDTVIELQVDEARKVVEAGIAERADHVGW